MWKFRIMRRGIGEEIKGMLLNMPLNTLHKTGPFTHTPKHTAAHCWQQSESSPKLLEKCVGVTGALKELDALN